MPRLATCLCLLYAALIGRVDASEYLETEDFADVVAVTEAYAEQYGPEQTLLVVDIDNTLLAMRGDLGGDSWFEWQEYLLNHEPDSPHLVASDFPGLLEIQGLLFQLGKMRPPQDNLPQLVSRCQDLGVPTLVLTSRGPDFRLATERELGSAGYEFASTCLAMDEMPRGDFYPVDPDQPEAVGLTKAELDRYKLSKPRLASLENGIYMTAGQHKGAMLLTALHHARQQPKAVVFVDDHGRHVHRVHDALTRRGIEVTVLHYKREDDNVARFRYSDKQDVTRRWRRLESTIAEVFDLPGKPLGDRVQRPERTANAPRSRSTAKKPIAEPAGG